MGEALLTGIVLGLALIFSVGPVIFAIIKLRINYGLSSAFYFIGGVWLSDALLVIIANSFSNFFTELLLFKKEIGIAGAALLMALGVYYLFIKKQKSKAELDNELRIGNATHIRLFVTGFLINMLNPGVIALWFAAATKTLDYSLQFKVLTFAVCLGMNMLADFFKIRLAGKMREKLNDRNIKLVNKIAGGIYMLFGLLLLLGAFFLNVKK